jgi:hypothetical protein
MRRKQLTPSVVRRCAVFLALGGALALGTGRAEGGIAPVEASDSQLGFPETGEFSVSGPGWEESNEVILGSSNRAQALAVASDKGHVQSPALSPDDLLGPGMTGAHWFEGFQRGVDQAFEPGQSATTPSATPNKVPASPFNGGVKANAIPSLPSFWSGLTCCLAVAGAGMIPRVRRAFLR